MVSAAPTVQKQKSTNARCCIYITYTCDCAVKITQYYPSNCCNISGILITLSEVNFPAFLQVTALGCKFLLQNPYFLHNEEVILGQLRAPLDYKDASSTLAHHLPSLLRLGVIAGTGREGAFLLFRV